MRFQVPQFIEVEDKIFGPLTIKQFVYLAGGAGAVFILYALLPFFLTVIFAIPVAAFVLALAFYKVNNQPFIKVVENALRFHSGAKLYLWKKTEPKARKKEELQSASAGMGGRRRSNEIYAPKLTKNKLQELSWSLDIKENIK